VTKLQSNSNASLLPIREAFEITGRYFYVEFPLTCDSFDGPHSLDCYRDLWIEAGCYVTGLAYPGEYDGSDFLHGQILSLL